MTPDPISAYILPAVVIPLFSLLTSGLPFAAGLEMLFPLNNLREVSRADSEMVAGGASRSKNFVGREDGGRGGGAVGR